MSKYPVKECDYCDHVGIAYTFGDGETVCKSCHLKLPIETGSLRKALVAAQRQNKKLREAMQEFVTRVDKGEVRSKYTYSKFTELLTEVE